MPSTVVRMQVIVNVEIIKVLMMYPMTLGTTDSKILVLSFASIINEQLLL